MQKKMIYIIWFFTYFVACSPTEVKDSFNSNVLISSKGEKIFVNSINWGVTDDYQLSVISKDSLRLKDRNDTIGTVQGLNPFIYEFNNDTLTLYFYNRISYKLNDKLNTITVLYKVVNDTEYLILTEKSYESDEYISVPISEKQTYPSDMPKAPEIVK